MNPHEEGDLKSDRSSFASRRWWVREVVLASGSFANWILAWGVLIALYVSGTHVPVPRTIGTVQPGSEAARAQLRPGDVIVGVDGRPLKDWGNLVETVIDNPGRPIRLDVFRGDAVVSVEVVPRSDERGLGRLGITQQYVFRKHSLGGAVGPAIRASVDMLREDLAMLWRLVRGKRGVELASPLLIVKQASDAAAIGLDAFFRMLVHVSLGLALFNLLPFPALDGGRMLFIGIEAATGRPVNPRLETALHASGFVLLLLLVALVAAGDFRKLLGGRGDTPPADRSSSLTDGGVPVSGGALPSGGVSGPPSPDAGS
jgi:regulator of sigma E protease